MLARILEQPPHNVSTLVLSIDDLYLPYLNQKELAANHPTNPLVQNRGQPSTHDLPLALTLFDSLRNKRETRIPVYDKSAFDGQGDRVDVRNWPVVNEKGRKKIEVVIFEGWCVGFRSLERSALHSRWKEAVAQKDQNTYRGRLGWNRVEDVEFINEALQAYDGLTRYGLI